MKPIVEKMLRSGLVDRATAELMERYRMIPDGASEIVREDALKDATQAQLAKLAEDLATEVEKEHRIKETHLDLERIRWPATVRLARAVKGSASNYETFVQELSAVTDRKGRFYFRMNDVKAEWLTPGYVICQNVPDPENPTATVSIAHLILEVQPLYIGDDAICYQVAVQ